MRVRKLLPILLAVTMFTGTFAYAEEPGGVYNFVDPKSEGTIVITKEWEDGLTNDEREIPDITISTVKPSKNILGYTITFDANGGSFADGGTTNEVVYNSSNVIVEGTYFKPTSKEGNFAGWYTDEGCTTAYEIDSNGIPTSLTEDVVLYANFLPVKYAVSIFDIEKDVDQNGNVMGITFGPAMGGDYVNSYKSHTASGTTSSGNAKRCVHNDDWETIISWNDTDPYVYEDCIEEGCTKSVPLDFSGTETIGNPDFVPSYTGDGPGVLFFELKQTKKNDENLTWQPNQGSNYDGWGTSRIRAMLNGADSLTDTGTDNYSWRYSSHINRSASIYTSTNCLLATLPEELQNAIGYRAVKYDSVYNEKTEANLKTTYDKLWLFSSNELGDSVSNSYYNHPLEGSVYKKLKGTGNVCTDSESRVVYRISSFEGGTNSNAGGSLLRSMDVGKYTDACLYSNGHVYIEATNVGPAFGFTLR